jgi:hypothetical protein
MPGSESGVDGMCRPHEKIATSSAGNGIAPRSPTSAASAQGISRARIAAMEASGQRRRSSSGAAQSTPMIARCHGSPGPSTNTASSSPQSAKPATIA